VALVKTVLVGLWVVAVALGATYGAALYLPSDTGSAKAAVGSVLQYDKTRVVNVPMIANGVVQGFIAVQFAFTLDAAALKTLKVPPEIYLLDEAFRTIYTDEHLDFHHLERYDLGKLTAHLVESTNAHLGAPLIKDVLIENFSYIDKDVSK
jgi:hypothetical protein